MAATVKPQHGRLGRAGSLSRLGYSLRLVPEMIGLPAVFGLFLLLGRPVALAWLGLGLIALFLLRITALLVAWRAWNQGHYSRAGRWAGSAGRLYPWSVDAITLQAMVAAAQGHVEQATALWQRAQQLFPGRAMHHIGLGEALAASGHWPEARWEALQALALDEQAAAAYALLAESSLQLNNALPMVLELTRLGLGCAFEAPTQVALYVCRAEAALGIGQRALAQTAMAQAVGLLVHCPAPLQAAAIFRLGQLRRRLGDQATALHDFERIATVDPEGRWIALAWKARQETILRAA